MRILGQIFFAAGHGGTNRGAPKGNRNGWKHGLQSAEAVALRKLARRIGCDHGMWGLHNEGRTGQGTA